MPALKDTVAALNAEDFRSNVKIMVGGAPITKEFADEIGADGYSEDAASAAVLQKLWQHRKIKQAALYCLCMA